MIARNPRAPLILKLGGSLVESGRIGPILTLAAGATRPLAIVAGGGPFADAVRRAQEKYNFSDLVAHRMAILAMHQMAFVFMGQQSRLAPAEALADFDKLWTRNLIPVWLPFRLADKDRRIPRDWSITSDGLAARLAERLAADGVVVMKSRCVAPRTPLADLVREGVVDSAFGTIVTRAHLEWQVLGPGEEDELARRIGAPQPGTKPDRR